MITESELQALLGDLESFRVERTVSTSDTTKFSQAVCAFANDLPASHLPGYLLIGADDNTGTPAGLRVTGEFLMNAVLHRSYEAPQPVRFYQYSDRIEIQNPGPLYGLARPENFPTQTSYRNPVLAEAMKTLGAVNRFGRGVERAQTALKQNGSPPAEFIFGDMHFGVTLRIRK